MIQYIHKEKQRGLHTMRTEKEIKKLHKKAQEFALKTALSNPQCCVMYQLKDDDKFIAGDRYIQFYIDSETCYLKNFTGEKTTRADICEKIYANAKATTEKDKYIYTGETFATKDNRFEVAKFAPANNYATEGSSNYKYIQLKFLKSFKNIPVEYYVINNGDAIAVKTPEGELLSTVFGVRYPKF